MEKKQFSPLFEILELNKFIYKKEHCLCYQYNWAFSNVDIKKTSFCLNARSEFWFCKALLDGLDLGCLRFTDNIRGTYQ